MAVLIQKKDLFDSPIHGDEEGASVFTWILYALIFVMIFFLAFVTFVSVCKVQQSSMNNTLFDGDNVLINKYPFSLKAGDIVVVKGDERTDHKDLIKRIIATGGDTLKFEFYTVSGQKYIKTLICPKGKTDFIEPDESFIKDRMIFNEYFSGLIGSTDEPVLIVIPENHYFIMGDNRNHSYDSRSLGSFHRDRVIGKEFSKLNPDSSWGKFLLWLYRSPA